MADKNVEVLLKDVRLSFFNGFEPQEFTDEVTGKKRWTYNTNALVPKKLPNGAPNPVVKQLGDAMKQAIENTWPGADKKIPPERRCVRDGEPIDPDTIDPDVAGSGQRFPLYEGYEGHVFISANRSVKSADAPNPVQLIGPKKTAKNDRGEAIFPRLKVSDGLLYSGCFANVLVRIYGYDGKGKNPDRVNASLEIVQFKRHGEAFGAKQVNADAYMEEEDSDDGDAFGPGASAPLDDDGIG
jgi:hypothetical protein